MAKLIGMAADHAGYELKEALKPLLNELGYEVKDFGTHSTESMDYPDVAHPLAEAVEKGEVCCGQRSALFVQQGRKRSGLRIPRCAFQRR